MLEDNKRAIPVWEIWLDLIYPRQCLWSGSMVESDSPFRYLSKEALRHAILAKQPACRTCGHPFWGAAEADQVCPHCLELEPLFQEGRTCALMRGVPRMLLIELKYHRGQHVLHDLATLASLVPGFLEFLEGATLVPVPLHPSKQRWRGFNQSEKLAQVLACRGQEIEVRDWLVRRRPTPSQTRLPRKERQLNVKGAFGLKRGIHLEPDRRVVILDDVFTTGATLNACSAVLRGAGIKKIDVATICHG